MLAELEKHGVSLKEVTDELVKDLLAHLAEHAAPELRDLSGDVEVGLDVDPGSRVALRERRSDGGRGGPLATGVSALGSEDRPVRGRVQFHEAGRPAVLGGDRPHLDLHHAAVLVTLDLE